MSININTVNQTKEILQSRSAIGGALKYLKENAMSSIGATCVAIPFIIGNECIYYYIGQSSNKNLTDRAFYNKLNGAVFYSGAFIFFNYLYNVAQFLVKNTWTYYHRIKERNNNYIPISHNDPIKNPNKYTTFLNGVKKTLIASTIAGINGFGMSYSGLEAKMGRLTDLYFLVSTILTNYLINRKTKKD